MPRRAAGPLVSRPDRTSSPGSSRPHVPAPCCSAPPRAFAPPTSQALRQPERLAIGPPFNPPHLIPPVEVVPGEKATQEVVERAVAFYPALGKKPQVLRKGAPGFVANRLQAALLRQAVNLVVEGVVTDVVIGTVSVTWPGITVATFVILFTVHAPERQSRARRRRCMNRSASGADVNLECVRRYGGRHR
ncbi:3-hydroxyacyl-CoA dehydrogenase NAD-binding domain-containing protein [Streptomyces mirabilis]|uniref:3-hydroxyacyl-CoA dehydrogenase NAD-binding domain-containing protein n=1 Tax=Streptomyces mirabilis TaxID=68239 RepID=UPI0033324BBB